MKNYPLFNGKCAVMYIIGCCLLVGPSTALGVTKPTAFGMTRVCEEQNQQQTITVTGTVRDGAGGLPGVTVRVKGKKAVALTDADGRYSISVEVGDVLVFSYVGFKEYTVTVGTDTALEVLLEEDATSLQEVTVNAGYYKVKDKERTGSIASIKAEDIARQPVSNPLAAMHGRMPGVNIVQTSGVPGGGFEIEIRGRNSIRLEGNAPLYLVDGVPYNADNAGSTLLSGGILPGSGLSPLNSINPADIESIEVLKDADATSIYGSRGANGVVLITTKKGREVKTRFSINTYTGAGTVTRKMELLNTQQYLSVRKQAYANDGITEYPSWAHDVNGNWDQSRYTDWQDELVGGTALTNSIQASVTGGNKNTQFLLGGSYYKESTVFSRRLCLPEVRYEHEHQPRFRGREVQCNLVCQLCRGPKQPAWYRPF